MVSVTLSIPPETKQRMESFPEINWSGFVRKCIEDKTNQLVWKEEMLKRFESKEEQEMLDWSVGLGKKAKQGRYVNLAKKG